MLDVPNAKYNREDGICDAYHSGTKPGCRNSGFLALE